MKKILAGNWKMNHGPRESAQFSTEFIQLLNSKKSELQKKFGVEVYAPAVSLSPLLKSFEGSLVSVGAQNAHFEKKGAFTGELSGPLLQEIGIQHVLIGHSERRTYFGETDQSALKRAHSLLQQGFSVLFCVGETKEERAKGLEKKRVRDQLQGIESWGSELRSRFRLAYEPVWAIGTGVVATPTEISSMHLEIRAILVEKWGPVNGSEVPLLYGGSVTPENFPAILKASEVQGALVGGASLKPDQFFTLLTQMLGSD